MALEKPAGMRIMLMENMLFIPGNNFTQHFIPFTEGAFKLNGKTEMASAVMPYYTISYNQDKKNNENVANSYNAYIINDLLRKKYKYDGVVCTDWFVTGDEVQSTYLSQENHGALKTYRLLKGIIKY